MCVLFFFFFKSTHPEVLHNEMQYVNQLWYSMPLLHNDFASPVRQHLVAVLHACRHCRSQDGHSLADYGPGLHCVGFQQAVEDLYRAQIACLIYQHTIYLAKIYCPLKVLFSCLHI